MTQTLVAAGLDIKDLDTISKEVPSESVKEASTFQQKDDTSIYCKFLLDSCKDWINAETECINLKCNIV